MRKTAISAVIFAGFIIPWRLAARKRIERPVRTLATWMFPVCLFWAWFIIRFFWKMSE